MPSGFFGGWVCRAVGGQDSDAALHAMGLTDEGNCVR